jgi:hypothetical protein
MTNINLAKSYIVCSSTYLRSFRKTTVASDNVSQLLLNFRYLFYLQKEKNRERKSRAYPLPFCSIEPGSLDGPNLFLSELRTVHGAGASGGGGAPLSDEDFELLDPDDFLRRRRFLSVKRTEKR